MLNSCIYEGVIRHRRRLPVKNCFRFSAFMFLLDLDELDDVFSGRWFWSTRRFAYATFQRADHLKTFAVDRSLRCCVKEVLVQHGLHDELGRVCLLTQLRYCGFRMNPVSFYYCYRASDQRLIAVIAEVNNTPWDEQHVYVIPDHRPETLPLENHTPTSERCTSSQSQLAPQRYIKAEKLKKSFHVSPFMHNAMHYRMIYSLPGESIGVKMENFESDEKIFDVSMLMHRRSITMLRLLWMSLKYPVYSLKVFAGIYFQALKLFLKKVPVHAHPDR